jgi:transcriptional regulator with XRE-family HTH domain
MYFGNNLKFLRKAKGFTQDELSFELDLKRSQIGSYEEGRAHPSYDKLMEICEYFKVSIDQIIKKDFRHMKEVPLFTDEQLNTPILQPSRVLAITVDDKQNENIEIVNAKAAAGYLNGYADPEYIKELNRFRLPFLPTGTYRAFEIKGDSMQPLPTGSIVIGEYVENLSDLKDGLTYVVVSKNDGIVYKRVFNKIDEEGALILRSDNPTYPTYNIMAQEILEIWKGVAHISHVNKGSDISYQNILSLMQELKQEIKDLKNN